MPRLLPLAEHFLPKYHTHTKQAHLNIRHKLQTSKAKCRVPAYSRGPNSRPVILARRRSSSEAVSACPKPGKRRRVLRWACNPPR